MGVAIGHGDVLMTQQELNQVQLNAVLNHRGSIGMSKRVYGHITMRCVQLCSFDSSSHPSAAVIFTEFHGKYVVPTAFAATKKYFLQPICDAERGRIPMLFTLDIDNASFQIYV